MIFCGFIFGMIALAGLAALGLARAAAADDAILKRFGALEECGSGEYVGIKQAIWHPLWRWIGWKRICAWHKPRPQRISGNPWAPHVTHGMCRECFERELRELKRSTTEFFQESTGGIKKTSFILQHNHK